MTSVLFYHSYNYSDPELASELASKGFIFLKGGGLKVA